eukprot:ctg_2107.g484
MAGGVEDRRGQRVPEPGGRAGECAHAGALRGHLANGRSGAHHRARGVDGRRAHHRGGGRRARTRARCGVQSHTRSGSAAGGHVAEAGDDHPGCREYPEGQRRRYRLLYGAHAVAHGAAGGAGHCVPVGRAERERGVAQPGRDQPVVPESVAGQEGERAAGTGGVPGALPGERCSPNGQNGGGRQRQQRDALREGLQILRSGDMRRGVSRPQGVIGDGRCNGARARRQTVRCREEHVGDAWQYLSRGTTRGT